MKYVVLFPDGETEGRSWAIIDAESPAKAAQVAGGRSVASDDKAYVLPYAEAVTVYAKIGWAE